MALDITSYRRHFALYAAVVLLARHLPNSRLTSLEAWLPELWASEISVRTKSLLRDHVQQKSFCIAMIQ